MANPPLEDGGEKTALDTVLVIYQLTSEILRRFGTGFGNMSSRLTRCSSGSRFLLTGAFQDAVRCREFRNELATSKPLFCTFTQVLADSADGGLNGIGAVWTPNAKTGIES